VTTNGQRLLLDTIYLNEAFRRARNTRGGVVTDDRGVVIKPKGGKPR